MTLDCLALIGEPVGIEEGEDGLWRVRVGSVPLGTIDASGRLRRPRAARAASSLGALRTSGAAQERMENCATIMPVAQAHKRSVRLCRWPLRRSST